MLCIAILVDRMLFLPPLPLTTLFPISWLLVILLILCMCLVIFLLLFSKCFFFLSLVFNNLTIMCLIVDLFVIILLGVGWVSCYCNVCHQNLCGFQTLLLQIYFFPASLLPYSKLHYLLNLMVFFSSLKLFIFCHSFSLCSSE